MSIQHKKHDVKTQFNLSIFSVNVFAYIYSDALDIKRNTCVDLFCITGIPSH